MSQNKPDRSADRWSFQFHWF